MPLSWCLPRSANAMPEPATRSRTVCETRTSFAAAWAATRAPMATAMPAILPSVISHSPVWIPARVGSPKSARSAVVARAPDRTRGAVKAREKTVAGRVDLAAAEPSQPRPDAPMMLADEFGPDAVSDARSPLSGSNNVGEEHGRERPLALRLLPVTPLPHRSQKRRDLIDYRLPVAAKGEVLIAGEFRESRARNLTRCPTCTRNRQRIADAVEDERRHGDRW